MNLFPCPGGTVKQACMFGSLAVDLNQEKLHTKLPGQTEPVAQFCRHTQQLAGLSASVLPVRQDLS